MNALVIFGRSDRTSSPNNLKQRAEWKEKLAKDNECLTVLFASPPPGRGDIRVSVLLEMFFPPGSSDPRHLADVLWVVGRSAGRVLTRCVRSEEDLRGQQNHGAFIPGHSAAWTAKPCAVSDTLGHFLKSLCGCTLRTGLRQHLYRCGIEAER